VVGVVAMSTLITAIPPAPARAQVPGVTPAANPEIEESCGLDVTLVLDASGSIQSSNAVAQVRKAAQAFLEALTNTNSQARVTQFATVSAELAPSTLVDDGALASGGVLRNAINGYYNPKPPRPAGVNFYQYTGSNPASASSFSLNNASSNNQYTNWDQGLGQAGSTTPELVVFVTDGDPTAYDFEAGDPIQPPHVAFSTDRNNAGRQVTLDRAVTAANAIKQNAVNTRVLAVGVGSALSNSASAERLEAVAGPQVVRDADLAGVDSINEIDVALVTDFDDLAAFLRSVVLQLCSPSLTIRKLAQSAASANYLPAPGWSMTVTPDTDNGEFDWILPDTAADVSKTVPTNADGFAQFQWEPDPGEQDSSAVVSEDIEPGFTPGRPGDDDNDFRCVLRDEFGATTTIDGELTVTGDTATFGLDPIGQEIVTCTVWNSFDYAPAIAVTKVDAPTEVRGDLDPPAVVTASYAVTNPGNTPLTIASITDDTCGVITPAVGAPNTGDTDGDGLLDVGETWLFTCTEDARASGGATPIEVTNTVTVVGVDPTGTTVQDSDDDTVTIYVPEIALEKLVNGVGSVTVTPGTVVTYTYAATNTGNTDLTGVTLVDDTEPCELPALDPDPPGDGDDIMQPGETWTWSCLATVTEPVVNTATVSGTPAIPGGAAFPDPNPPVTATDVAAVDVVDPNIDLQKSVSPDVVVLSEDPADSAPVTYTFTATNPDDGDPTPVPPLNRPDGLSATDPGWITDAQCLEPATYDPDEQPGGGDVNDNALLDPGETWTFTCPGEVSARTVNLATITGQPSDATGAPLPGVDPVSDLAVAFVDVLRPAIDIVKTALVPVVLDESLVAPDPGAPISGPDVPAPPATTTVRPARYLYDVTNTGAVPLRLTAVPIDDTCSPLVPVPAGGAPQRGDRNGDGLLGVNETWHFSCSTTLDREGDANPPPVTGDESGLVTNEVDVAGIPELGGTAFPDKSVSASDIAQVLVIEPGITLVKSASASVVRADDDVTYTVAVSNTGDVGLDVIGPQDDKCSPLELIDGDNGNGILDGADSGAPETWTYTCTRAIPLPDSGVETDVNSATVVGVDPLGNVYVATDTAEVRVFDPAIQLTKVVSATLVPAGTEVTYGFEVVNTGASPVAADDVLADIQLVDVSEPAVPSCLRPTFVGGDSDGDGLLPRQPAETWTYACTATITEPTTDVAAVRGTGGTLFGPPLPIDVFDLDAQFVQVFHPAIEVTKTAAPTELLGSGPVTYTYLVRNTGDVPLAGVAARITDDTCTPVTYVSGDEDGDGLLDTPNSIFEDALDETWTFTCVTTVAATTSNTVVVTGTPTDQGGVALCADTRAVALARVSVSCDATDSAAATVTVTPPATTGTIVIVKRTPAPTTATFAFTVEAVVGPPPAVPLACDPSYPTTCIPPPPPDLDCSDVTPRNFTVRAPDPHRFDGDLNGIGCEDDERITLRRDESRALTGLAPGTYVVTDQIAGRWELSALACTDPSNDTAVALASRRATVQLTAGETVTCTFTNRPSGALPATGTAIAQLLAVAAAAVAVGAGLTALQRRRRRPILPS
jgi:hypothetical protein